MVRFWLCILAFAMVPPPAQAKHPLRTVTVKVQASELDRDTLMQKLNKDAKNRHLRFVEVGGKNYDYRIVFSAGEKGNPKVPGYGGIWSMTVHYSDTTVFGPTGTELFRFHSDNDYTNGGATNAAAKGIINRLRRLWKLRSKDKR